MYTWSYVEGRSFDRRERREKERRREKGRHSFEDSHEGMGILSSRMKGEGRQAYDLDEKWSNLYREREKNHLYKWVGVRKG